MTRGGVIYETKLIVILIILAAFVSSCTYRDRLSELTTVEREILCQYLEDGYISNSLETFGILNKIRHKGIITFSDLFIKEVNGEEVYVFCHVTHERLTKNLDFICGTEITNST